MPDKSNTNEAGSKGVRWDLSDLYGGLNDTQIAKDIETAKTRAVQFESEFRGKINSPDSTAPTVLRAVEEIESISETLGKLLSFAYLMFAGDTSNSEHGAFLQRMQEDATNIRKHLLFFELEWAELDSEIADKIINDNKVKHYKHFLELERKYFPHRLSEPEEKVLDEKSNTGSRAFKRLFDEVLNNVRFKVRMDGKLKTLTETEALSLLYDPRREIRKSAAKAITKGLKDNAHVLTFIFNTLVQDHSVNDRLRSFEHPMASRNLDNEIDMETVGGLMKACEDYNHLVARYYKIKKALLGVPKFYDYDRYAPIYSDTTVIHYDKAKEIILDSFGDFSGEMAGIAGLFFEKNWIDAELRTGKRGGAFSHSTVPSVHPYVFTNYTGKMRDVMTLAHELGHGIHQYLSRENGYFQSNTPLTTAETASVFGEILVFHSLKESAPDTRTKLALLCSKLEDIFATVFRQVVLTRFEEKLHSARRSEGELGHDRINELWAEANSPMFGDTVQMTKDYRWWWMYIPHFIHSPFYCYAYSFGELLVLALYNMYLKDADDFVPKYLTLLSRGGSDSPEKLLSTVGVDIGDPGFWTGGLEVIKDMVEEAWELSEAPG